MCVQSAGINVRYILLHVPLLGDGRRSRGWRPRGWHWYPVIIVTNGVRLMPGWTTPGSDIVL